MRILPFLIFLLAIAFSGNAQNSAAIKGRIYNSKNGEAVPFATVSVWNSSNGTTANESGQFEIKGVKSGYIQLKVTAVGFKPIITSEVLVTNAKSAKLDIALEETSVAIGEVTVKASTFRRSQESPVSLSRIGIEEIEKNPGGNRDISRVIQSFPGVSQSTSYRNDLIVRGGGPSENKFYLDGVEIPTINHFSTQGASGGPVGIINVDFIREVNFYSGAFPSSTGNALSSILDFRMIDGNSDNLKFRTTLGATDLGLTVDGPLSSKTTFIASVRRSYLKFLFQALKLPFLPTYNDVQFKVKTRFNEKNELTFIGLGAYDISRLNTGIKNPDDGQRLILNSLPQNDQWNYTLGAVYKRYRAKSVDTWVISRSHLYNRAYKYVDNDNSKPYMLNYTSEEIRNNLRYEHSLTIGRYKVGVGANAGVDQYTSDTYKLDYKNNQPSVTDFNSDLSLLSYGAYANISGAYYDDRLSLALGLRVDGNSYSSATQNPAEQLSPRFSLSYELAKGFYFNFNTGMYYQTPPLTALGYADNSGVLVNKQHNLKYIRSNHIVAGVEYRPSEKDKLTLEGFYKTYDRYLFSLTDSISIAGRGGDYGVFGNEELSSSAKGESYGLELMYRSKDFFGFNLVGAYTLFWSRAKNLNPRITQSWIPTSWDNRNILTLTGSRKLPKGWEFGLKWRYLGGAPFTPFDLDKSSVKSAYDAIGGLYYDYARFNQSRLTSYYQLDIRVDKTYYYKKLSVNVYWDIQNVTNSKVAQPDTYLPKRDASGNPVVVPGNPERYELVKVNRSRSMAILPTFGLIIDF